ncbi:MAG: glycosyltransferase [Myxococcales bacterium]
MTMTPPGKDRVTTLDVWDTLLRRRCHPDEVKLASADFVRIHHGARLLPEFASASAIFQQRRQAEIRIGNKNRAEGHDDEYRLIDVWRSALTVMLKPSESALLEEVAAAAQRSELAFEDRVTYANPSIRAFLQEQAVSEAHLLSDFYVGGADLLELVRRKHPGLALAGAMVSCDEGVTKRSGRLYRRFERVCEIEPAQHLHIGDNQESDVLSARRVGLTALHYQDAVEEQKRANLAKQFEARMKGDYSSYWKTLRSRGAASAAADARHEDPRFQFGVELAPLYVLYVLFALEQAARAGVDKVYYFTREGEVLARIHAAIAAACPDRQLPAADLLEVSRLATFGASIAGLELPELNRFWTMYSRHSVNTLLVSLGLDPAAYADLVWEAGLDPEQLVIEPWRDPRFLGLLENPSFKSKVEAGLARRRADLMDYFGQHGLTPQSRRAVVVEIGWRGTIQDNLARIFPDVEWQGVYLALFRYLNTQPENALKTAFLLNDNQGDTAEKVLRPQAPLEMLFNSASGSVTGYVREGERVVATRKSAEGEDRVFHAFTGMVQEGVLASVPGIVHFLEERALSPLELRMQARRMAEDLLSMPPRAFARAYFELEHNETFGVGGFVRKEGQLVRDVLRTGSASKAWKLLSERPKESGWVAGFHAAHSGAGGADVITRLAAGQKDLKRVPKLLGRISREVWKGTKKRGLVPVLADIRDAFVTKPQPAPESIRMIPLVQTAELQNEHLLRFNEEMLSARRAASGPFVVAWLIPDIGYGSGGHMTLLRFVRHFRSLGIVNKVYVHGKSRHRDRTALEKFVRTNYGPIEGIEFYENSETIDDSDILIATHWTTAYEVFRQENTRFKAYFIQDFEPHFYPKGSLGVFAENTYAMNLYGVCASPWLFEVAQRYGMQACGFHLGYEPETYYVDPLAERDPNRVVVYMRPSTERRGTELLLAALLLVQRERPQTRISIFGTPSIPAVGLKAEIMGLLNEEQLRRLHSASAITLLTSLTNYSLMPIEAMACGSVVIDLDVESMRATFGIDAPISLVKPDPQAIAREILELLNDREKLAEKSAACIAYAQGFQWSRAFDEVSSALFAQYFRGTLADARGAKLSGLVRPRGGTQFYSVRAGQKVALSDDEVSGSAEQIDPRTLLALPTG